LESELFGYEVGAFTGAQKRKPGLMEVADEGILFLDEISSMPVDMQVKLLRAIEDHSFRRVGGTNMIKVDVMLLAASNRDLNQLMKDGYFREDLFYRLKVVDLHLPPLRERKEDIPELVGYFIRHNNMRMGLNIINITPRALSALSDHSWPGNIRELRNAIERAMLFCDDSTIDLHHLSNEFC
jgi:transcriptional regulator with PAS, ATPase and Fis domain